MGILGGSSSKRTENNYDNRALNAAGNTGQAVMGEGNTVNVIYSDHGAVNSAFEFGGQALQFMAEGQAGALEYSALASDRAFDAVDKASSEAYGFAGHAFDAALQDTAEARAQLFTAVSQANDRIDDVYRTSGRETTEDAMSAVKTVAGVAGIGLLLMLIMGARRA
jgi:hypothetical protein